MNTRLVHAFEAISAGMQDIIPVRWRPAVARNWNWIAGAILLLIAGLLWFLFTGPTAPKAPPPPPVGVIAVQMRPVEMTESQIGTVVSVATVQVTALVTGQLLSANFNEGQLVRRGDVIFRIDPKPFIAALEQAKAAYARDEATLLSAEKDKERYLALAAQGAASAQQRDQAVAAADADAATVKADKAAIDAAELNLGYTTIRSPITGKTGPLLVQPGNLVVANSASNPLVVITQLQPIKVSFFMPQSDLPELQARQRAGTLKAIVTMHGSNGGPIEAPVDFISNQVNAQTGTIELRATFANQDYRLVPGQLVDVKVTVGDLPHALVVPREAVYLGPSSHYVYVVDNDGRAQMRNVDVVFDDGTNDVVSGPLRAGDRVITEGAIRVVPDAKVEIVNRSVQTGGSLPTVP